MSVRGIDVSSYQSETPDLDGMDFCFVKATEGTSYVNPKMWAQAEHAREAGLVVGFYHFLRPGSMRDQARYFVEKCASRHGDPLIADWEDARVSQADRDQFLQEVLRLRGDTHQVGLYCNTNYWFTRDSNHGGPADFLWIAVYNGRPGRPGIRDPWLFHQYTSTPIDKSVSTLTSRAALRAWAEEKSGRHAEEDPVAGLSDEEFYDKAWRHDGVMKSPWGTEDNPTWMPESVLERTAEGVHNLELSVPKLAGQIGALAAIVGRLAEGGGITAEELQAAAEAGGEAGARTALAELGTRLTKES